MTAFQDQLASPHAGVLYLVELQCMTETVRMTNWTHALQWGGHEWRGFGSLLSVSQIESTEQLQWPAVDLGLNISNPAHLRLALGHVQEYRGRPVTIRFVLLDDEARMVGEPEVVWAGLMDQMRVKTGTPDDGSGQAEDGAVVLRCEMVGRDSRAATSLRLTHAQQIARHPGDTGLSRIEQLTGQPVTWLSKRFQTQE